MARVGQEVLDLAARAGLSLDDRCYEAEMARVGQEVLPEQTRPYEGEW
jgi:hypothetical protein